MIERKYTTKVDERTCSLYRYDVKSANFALYEY